MAAIVIKSGNAKNLRLLASPAKSPGDHATSVNAEALEDLVPGELMNHQETGGKANKQEILKMPGR